MKIYHRVLNGIKIGLWCIKHPEPLMGNMFEMLGKLLELIMQVAAEDRPYMTKIMLTINDEGVSQPIVCIWAGAGASADPLNRIEDLCIENEKLKEMVKLSGEQRDESAPASSST